MMLTRRFAVIFALMFWQGGFMFYGAVTVPVTRSIFESHPKPAPEPSLITRRVTQWMNLVGTFALLATFADCWASAVARKRWRWVGWLLMALPHPVIIWMHHEMSGQMDTQGFHSSPMLEFHHWHQIYLILNTIQWLGGMLFAVQSLMAWRAEDRAVLAPSAEASSPFAAGSTSS
jgi:hypothetical protein